MTLYLKIVNLFRKITLPRHYLSNYSLNITAFEDLINSYPYKMDPLHGAWDYIADPDDFFDEKRKSGRDCDDFQRQWSLWAIYQGYTAREYVICDPSSIKTAFNTMHVIGTIRTGKKYYLSNYRIKGPFRTEEEALDYMKNYPSYEKDSLIVFSRELTPEILN